MALETGSYINDLVITNPTSSDAKSQGDDHFRLLKAVIKECLNGFTGGILLTATETGTASAHVLTPTTALVGYTTGLMLLYRPTNAGTGALTVNVSGLGAKSVKTIAGADPTSGDILVNQPVLLMYDGTNFVILAGSEYLSKTGNQTLTGNLTLTGNQTVSGTLGVTGAASFAGTASFAIGPTAPTAAVGTGTTQVATTEFVGAVAMSAALPSQTGNSGKFVTTDGINASWEDVLPAQASNAGKVLTTDGTDTSWADGAYSPTLTSAIVTLASAGATNGLHSRVTIDSNRELLFIGNTGMSAVVYDNTTKTFGTVVLVRATGITVTHAAILIGTDKVLLASCTGSSTAFEAVVLTISGTTITVNTAATSTLASACSSMSSDCCAAGSSYVFGMQMTTNYAVAITVSGTTPTIGTALNVTGNSAAPSIFAVDATRVLAIHPNAGATTIIATPLTVSGGTTLTAGTTANVTGSQSQGGYTTPLTTGRWAMVYQNTTSYGAIITLTGTVATISSVNLSAAGSSSLGVVKIGDQLLVTVSTTKVNVLTDVSGTATAGTELTTGITTINSSGFVGYGTDYGALLTCSLSGSTYVIVKISGNSAYIHESLATYAGTLACGFPSNPSRLGHRGTVCYGVVSNGTKSSVIANFGNLATNTPMGMTFGSASGHVVALLPALNTSSSLNLFRQSDAVYWSGFQAVASTALRLNRVEMI